MKKLTTTQFAENFIETIIPVLALHNMVEHPDYVSQCEDCKATMNGDLLRPIDANTVEISELTCDEWKIKKLLE